MRKRTLTREYIVSTAFNMIDEKGLKAFSLRKLALKLNVQTSSLYNHINNYEDLLLEVACRAGVTYSGYIESLITGLSADEATHVAGDAFIGFVKDHKYLYELLLNNKWKNNLDDQKVEECFTQPIEGLMRLYGIEDSVDKERLYVLMRVVTHGYASLHTQGIFDRLPDSGIGAYHYLIDSVIDTMKKMGKKQ